MWVFCLKCGLSMENALKQFHYIDVYVHTEYWFIMMDFYQTVVLHCFHQTSFSCTDLKHQYNKIKWQHFCFSMPALMPTCDQSTWLWDSMSCTKMKSMYEVVCPGQNPLFCHRFITPLALLDDRGMYINCHVCVLAFLCSIADIPVITF